MTDLTRAEIEALVNLRQFSGETRVKTNRAITQLLRQLDAATAERNGLLRAVTDNHVALQRAETAEAARDVAAGQMLERCIGVIAKGGLHTIQSRVDALRVLPLHEEPKP